MSAGLLRRRNLLALAPLLLAACATTAGVESPPMLRQSAG